MNCIHCDFKMNENALKCMGCGSMKVTRNETIPPFALLSMFVLWASGYIVIFAISYTNFNVIWNYKEPLKKITGCLIVVTAKWAGPMNLPQLENKRTNNVVIARKACEAIESEELTKLISQKLVYIKKTGDFYFESWRFSSLPTTLKYTSGEAKTGLFSDRAESIPISNFKGISWTIMLLLATWLAVRLFKKIWVAIFGRYSDLFWLKGNF